MNTLPKVERQKRNKFLIIYWLDTNPLYSIFDNELEARKMAESKNATFFELSNNFELKAIVDYYRRDDNDNPMPIKNKEPKVSIKGLKSEDLE